MCATSSIGRGTTCFRVLLMFWVFANPLQIWKMFQSMNDLLYWQVGNLCSILIAG